MSSQVLCIGELLWDLFPEGKRVLGGAPANVAYHLRQLGFDARLVSRVGADELGRLARAELDRAGIPAEDLQVDPILPTGSASVEMHTGGDVGYRFVTPAAWDAIEMPDRVAGCAVVFGTLAQRDPRARATIRSLAATATMERIYDVNLRAPFTPIELVEESLRLATIVKMNEEEARILASFLDVTAEPGAFARSLLDRYDLKVICVTRGGRGAWLASRSGAAHEVDGIDICTLDPVGAGDAFLAAIVAGRLRGIPEADALIEANRLGAWVASQRGAMPSYPKGPRP